MSGWTSSPHARPRHCSRRPGKVSAPSLTAPLIAFVCPRPNGHMGAQVGDCGGLFGCAHRLLRSEGRRDRYDAPPQRRESFVCRFPLPRCLNRNSLTFVGFECHRGCCPLLSDYPADTGLQYCAGVSRNAPPHAHPSRSIGAIFSHPCLLLTHAVLQDPGLR